MDYQTNPLPLVGLIGKKRSGKDTFAAPLVAEFGFHRVAFADPLREAALRLDPLVGPCSLPGDPAPRHRYLSEVIRAIGWEAAKDTVPGARRTLERLGTDAIREIDPDFWIRQALGAIDGRHAPVVVTDVRFPNEADAIRERGGYLVRITRPGFEDAQQHKTETALDDYPDDLHVVNDDTIEHLEIVARSIYYRFL
jgi:hypothetical protein